MQDFTRVTSGGVAAVRGEGRLSLEKYRLTTFQDSCRRSVNVAPQRLYHVVILLLLLTVFYVILAFRCRSQWPRGLRRRSAAAHLLRAWVRIPPGAWMFVCCECCVLSGRGLCDDLITRPEESYRPWCFVVCDLKNFKNGEAMTRVGSQRHNKKINK